MIDKKIKEEEAREYLQRFFSKHGYKISGTLYRPIEKIVEVIGLDRESAIKIMAEMIDENTKMVLSGLAKETKLHVVNKKSEK